MFLDEFFFFRIWMKVYLTESVESPRDPSGHVNADADTETWPQGVNAPVPT